MVINLAITVVVDAVAELGRAVVDLHVGVVAVRVAGDHVERRALARDHRRLVRAAGTVAVRVVVVRGTDLGFLVHRTVAVVVRAVAGLRGAGVDVGRGVVAVGVVVDEAAGPIAGAHDDLGGAEPVAVRVQVPGGLVCRRVVRDTIAVVVLAVAALRRAGVNPGLGVLAVGVVVDERRGTVDAGGDGDGRRRVAVAIVVRVGVPLVALAGDLVGLRGGSVGGSIRRDRLVGGAASKEEHQKGQHAYITRGA